jgi:hypothetical protein
MIYKNEFIEGIILFNNKQFVRKMELIEEIEKLQSRSSKIEFEINKNKKTLENLKKDVNQSN